ncbi:MAG: Zn-ribbon domain-containing OB-fold protein [Candidimonas sp.]|nr:Zn-ribbon domain-containing OB-fold protein [Candidimonas sp.]
MSPIPSKQLAPGPEATYLKGLAQGTWRIQRCTECSRHVFPPRQYCPACESAKLEWVAPRPTGTVYSTTVVRLDPQQPYNVALIDLTDGVRMMSSVTCPDPGDVYIGMPVRAEIEGSGDEARIVFHPVAKEA